MEDVMTIRPSSTLALAALAAAAIMLSTPAQAATSPLGNQVLDVWPGGTAPGAAPSNVPEGSVDITNPKNNTTDTIVTNVTRPSLEVFRPTGPSNGAAIIDAPGGGFHVLSYANEGARVAQWLANRGFTVFVLKYRLYPMPTDPNEIMRLTTTMGAPPGAGGPRPGAAAPGGPPPGGPPPGAGAPAGPPMQMGPQEEAAIADGTQALKVVRGLAATYGFDPAKVGFIGFSAGGVVAGSQGVNPNPADRANFVGIIYSFVPGPIPSGASPAFMAAAADDPLSRSMPALFMSWRQADAPAELHIYAKGHHGFGTNKQGLPVDGWMDVFYAWMAQQGFVSSPPH
jgi:acetyl esterase/lipase